MMADHKDRATRVNSCDTREEGQQETDLSGSGKASSRQKKRKTQRILPVVRRLKYGSRMRG